MIQALAFYVFAAVTLLSALMVITARNPVHSVFFLILAFFSSAGLFILQGAEFLALLLVVVYVGAVAVLFLFVVMMLDIPVPDFKAWFIPKSRAFIVSILSLSGYLVVFLGLAYLMIAIVSFVMGQVGISIIGSEAFVLQPVEELTRVVKVINQFGYLGVAWLFLLILAVFMSARYLTTHLVRFSFTTCWKNFIEHAPIGLILIGFLLVELMLVIRMWGDLDIARENALQTMQPETMVSNTNVLGQVLYTDYLYIFQTSGLILLVAMIGAIVLTHRTRTNVKRQSIADQIKRTKQEEISLRKVEVGKGISGWD